MGRDTAYLDHKCDVNEGIYEEENGSDLSRPAGRGFKEAENVPWERTLTYSDRKNDVKSTIHEKKDGIDLS